MYKRQVLDKKRVAQEHMNLNRITARIVNREEEMGNLSPVGSNQNILLNNYLKAKVGMSRKYQGSVLDKKMAAQEHMNVDCVTARVGNWEEKMDKLLVNPPPVGSDRNILLKNNLKVKVCTSQKYHRSVLGKKMAAQEHMNLNRTTGNKDIEEE